MRYWPLVLSAGLCAAVYAPNVGAPFAWDDKSVIAQNPVLDHPIPGKDFVSRKYYTFSGEQSWRPLATLSYALLVRVVGKSPAALRGLHLLLHGVNAALLGLLLSELGLGAQAAAWAAALFLIHAAHVETLMCVAFNEEILVSLGLLAMVFAHRRRRRWLAAGAFAFALLSKETGVIGLPLAFLSDLLETGKPLRRRRDYALYCVPLAAYLYVHFGPMKGPGSEMHAFGLSVATRIFFGLASLATAARVFLAPLDLRIEYFALPPHSSDEWLRWGTAGLLTLATWGWLIARSFKKRPGLAFLLLWPAPFLILTSPALPVTVFNTRLFAERWLYLPALGLAGAAACWSAKRPAWGTALLMFWAACGALRAADWSAETRLWTSLLDDYPWCAKAEEGLGEARFKRGDYAGAREAFERALFLRDGRQDKVLSAYSAYSEGGFVAWESPSLHRWLGHALYKLGHIEEADAQFQEAARLDPADGFVYMVPAYAWARAGDLDKARAWIAKGLAAHPEDAFLLSLQKDLRGGKLTLRASFD